MGFEITENSLEDLYDAFERIESCEAEEPSSGDKHKQESASKAHKKAKSSSQNCPNSTFCSLHGTDKGHNTDECKVLLHQVKKLKEKHRHHDKRDHKGQSKSGSFPKSEKELHSYAEKYHKKKMKSIEKEHFQMDSFNYDNDDDSKSSSESEDTLEQENNNFQKLPEDSDDEETSMEA